MFVYFDGAQTSGPENTNRRGQWLDTNCGVATPADTDEEVARLELDSRRRRRRKERARAPQVQC